MSFHLDCSSNFEKLAKLFIPADSDCIRVQCDGGFTGYSYRLHCFEKWLQELKVAENISLAKLKKVAIYVGG